MKKISFLICAVTMQYLHIFSFNCFGQLSANEYSITFLTTNDGLSQATNFYMLHDKKGYMWLSSQDGINRYNGKEFFHFSDSIYYENCKPFKTVYGIVEDINGDIWMGGKQRLFKFQQHRNSFIEYKVAKTNQLNENTCMVFASKDNEIWFSENFLSFKAIDCTTKKIRPLYTIDESLKLISALITIPQVDKNGNIWMVNGNVLYEINVNGKLAQKYILYFPNKKNSENNLCRGLSIHKDSNVLAIATENGLILFDIVNKKQLPVNDDKNLVTGKIIWAVKAGNNSFWVSDSSSKLIKVGLYGESVKPMFEKKVLDNDQYRGSETECIYEDRWNRVWLNANGEYTAIINLKAPFLKKVSTGRPAGLPSGAMQGITIAGDVIWASDSYLSIVEKRSGKVIKTFSTKDAAVVTPYFRQVFYDSIMERIWFSTGADLQYYSLKAKRFEKTKFHAEGSPNYDYIRNFLLLKSGEFLMIRNDAVFRIDRDDGSGQLLKELSNGNINHGCELSGSRLALSHTNNEIRIFKYGQDIQLQLLQKIQLGHPVLMTSEDSTRKNMWAATELGLYKIDNSSGNILRHYTVADGMANDYVYAAIPDNYGWVWCSTNRGVVAINGETNEVMNFDLNQNLQSLEFNNRVFEKDNEGYIYFGGTSGFNYFQPPYIDEDTVEPRLVIEEINLNNASYENQLNPDLLDKITYKYGTSVLKIKVLALHLIKSKKIKIRYRLSSQPNWQEINNDENIQMFNLAPGAYQLEISYTDGNNNKKFPVRTLFIEVMPPWYRTQWFYIGLVLASLTAAYYVIRNRFEKFRRRQQEQLQLIVSTQEAEKKNLASELHDDLGVRISALKYFVSSLQKYIQPKEKEADETYQKTIHTIDETMEEIRYLLINLSPKTLNEYGYLVAVEDLVNKLTRLQIIDISLRQTGMEKRFSTEVESGLYRITQELINNTLKHAHAKSIQLEVKRIENEIVLNYADDGKGYMPVQNSKGYGLQNIHTRVSLLKGEIRWNTSEKNTSVGIKIPLNHTLG